MAAMRANLAPLTMSGHNWVVLAIGFVVSFIVALGVVAWFMRWVRARGFAPFAIYRIVLAVVPAWIAHRAVSSSPCLKRSDSPRSAKLRALRRCALRIQRHADAGRRAQRHSRRRSCRSITCGFASGRAGAAARENSARNRGIVGVDEQQVIAQAEVEFELKEMEGHATNVHYFGGVQFQQFGLHHVEIYLGDELRLRFPLPVVQVNQSRRQH